MIVSIFTSPAYNIFENVMKIKKYYEILWHREYEGTDTGEHWDEINGACI